MKTIKMKKTIMIDIYVEEGDLRQMWKEEGFSDWETIKPFWDGDKLANGSKIYRLGMREVKLIKKGRPRYA